MELAQPHVAEELANLIREKRNILLVTHAKMDCDALSSTIALYLILRKLGKNVTAICQDPVPEAFKFLPDTDLMNTGFAENSDFIITLDISKTALESLKWNVEGNKVNIILSGKDGNIFSSEDLSFHGGKGKNFDLIIACDAADIQQLGGIYEQNAELFHSIPLAVIDHHASNEGFGVVNYIVPTNASTTETLYDLIPTLTGKGYEFINEDIATLLLAGIITDTGSFQHPNTTPKSFEVAAELIDLGARQQEIIRHLFKTKKLTTLRLWGRVLSRLKYDPVHRFVWSTVTREDLSDEQATYDETEGLIDELMSNAPGVEVILLLKEREDGIVSGSLRTTTPLCDATQIAGLFGGGGHRQAAGFKIRDANLFEAAVTEAVQKIEAFQEDRLGINAESKVKVPAKEVETPKDALLKKVLYEVKEKSEALEKPEDFEPKTSVLSTISHENRSLEQPSDFETKNGVPAKIETPVRALEDRHDFVPFEKAPSKNEAPKSPASAPVMKIATSEVQEPEEEIPNWLYDEKKEPQKTEKEDLNGVIPDWLKEASEAKKPVERKTDILSEHPLNASQPKPAAALTPTPPLEQAKANPVSAPLVASLSTAPQAEQSTESTGNKKKKRKKKKKLSGEQGGSSAPLSTSAPQQKGDRASPMAGVEKTAPMPTTSEQPATSFPSPATPNQPLSATLPPPVKSEVLPLEPKTPQPSPAAPSTAQPIVPPQSAPASSPVPSSSIPNPGMTAPIAPSVPTLSSGQATSTAPSSPSAFNPTAPVPPVSVPAPQPTPPAPVKPAPQLEDSPLGNILDPNPPADLIPQMPKAPARPQPPTPPWAAPMGGATPPQPWGPPSPPQGWMPPQPNAPMPQPNWNQGQPPLPPYGPPSAPQGNWNPQPPQGMSPQWSPPQGQTPGNPYPPQAPWNQPQPPGPYPPYPPQPQGPGQSYSPPQPPYPAAPPQF